MSAPYVYQGSIVVPLSGSSQGLIDIGDKWPKVVVQAHMRTNSTYEILLQPTGGSATDVFLSGTSNVKWLSASQVTTTTGAFGNQPAGDTLHAVSNNAADKTQKITVYATTASGGTVKAYSAYLNGTTAVNIGSTAPYDYQGTSASGNFQTILGIELSAACAGTVTLQEASGNQTIKAIAAGTLSAGITNITAGSSQNAYGLPVVVVAGGASTKIVGVYGQPIQSDGSAGEEITLSGTTAVYGIRGYAKIEKLLWGDVANGTTVSFGQYGITNSSGGDTALADYGTGSGPEFEFSNKRYLAWACYNGTTLTAAGANDRLRIAIYG